MYPVCSNCGMCLTCNGLGIVTSHTCWPKEGDGWGGTFIIDFGVPYEKCHKPIGEPNKKNWKKNIYKKHLKRKYKRFSWE